jgi:dTDP-4-amino-4,6-dideoxygalactose transaminase
MGARAAAGGRKAAAVPAAERIPLLDLPLQWKSLEKEILAELREVFREADFILGRRVETLEREIAALSGTRHAVACASGTDAILLVLRALGIGRGHEVVTTPFTFFATAGAVWNAGARPVFADIEEDSFNLDPRAAAAALTSRTRAVMPVHLFGRCASMAEFLALCAPRNLSVIEDAAQAIGASYRKFPAGSMGDAGTLSFYPSKNLGGAGDGGMVVTSIAPLAEHLRRARNHGQAARYDHRFVGTNSRMDGLQAAVLLAKLRRLDAWTEARGVRARRYGELLAGCPGIRLPAHLPAGAGRHAWNQYTIHAERRDALRAHLAERGIETAVYYPVPLHLQPCFASLGGRRGQFPRAERAAAEVLSLPVHPDLAEADQERVAAAIRGFHGKA